MPDPVVILTAMGLAFAVSAVVLGALGWLRRDQALTWVDAGWVLGIGAGFFLGCWALGNRPHWPVREDQDRFFILVLPAVLVVDLLASFPRLPRWLIWALRLVLMAGVVPILLYGTTYLSDPDGSDPDAWSMSRACLILGGPAALLASVWLLLALLEYRAPRVTHAVCLAITIAAAAVAVMLSGYATGGQNGLTLAAALLGPATLMAILGWGSRGTRPLGVAIVGLYSLLVVGRYFGELSSAHAILLFVCPVLAWLPELPGLRRLPRWVRECSRVVVVALAASAIVFDAGRKVFENPAPAPSTDEPTAEDHSNFGR
jgi:hypothetical protein